DWIIDSVNEDKGYDRMIEERRAGDEIAPTDPKILRATGFLARNYYLYNRDVWLQDTVEHTATAFLGLTFRCARCHDHKYDPIAQEEYYKFRAFFEPYDVRTDPVPGHADPGKLGLPRAYDAEPKEATKDAPFLPAVFAKTYRFIRGDEKNPDLSHPLEPATPEALGGPKLEITPVKLPFQATYPELQPFAQRDLMAQATERIASAEAALEKARRNLERARKPAAEPPAARPAAEAPAVDFEREVKPILAKSCFGCHSSANVRSGLVLDTVDSILLGGDKKGPAAIPRRSAER